MRKLPSLAEEFQGRCVQYAVFQAGGRDGGADPPVHDTIAGTVVFVSFHEGLAVGDPEAQYRDIWTYRS